MWAGFSCSRSCGGCRSDAHTHSLRRQFATEALAADPHELASISVVLGHESIKTTLRFYIHASAGDEKRIGALMNARWASKLVNADQEVDIVVEGTFDGDPVVTSIEVIEHGRPATVEWVERQIGKHRTLPTNRLMLVSKSGFSSLARATIAKEGGWVAAVTPEPVMVDGQLSVKSLFMDTIQLKSNAYRLYVLNPDGQFLEGNIPHASVICDASGNELGTAEGLAKEIFHLPSLRERFGEAAHHHP